MIINKEFLKSLNPCADRWKNYLNHYDTWEGTTLEFLELDKISDEDKLWVCLRPEVVPEKELHLLACQYAEDVLYLFEKECPDDKRPRQVIEAKRKWVAGEISDKELAAARDAAWDAQDAVWAIWDAWDAARAAWDAAWADWDAARDAAWVARDARDARDTRDAAAKKQVDQLRELLEKLLEE